MTTPEKFLQMFIAIGGFVAFFGILLLFVSRVRGRASEPLTALAFIGPALAMLAFGLLYPGALTVQQSFQNADSSAYVGLESTVQSDAGNEPMSRPAEPADVKAGESPREEDESSGTSVTPDQPEDQTRSVDGDEEASE